ncbi:MAG: hypothetical protein KO316_00785 [Methanobacterium sp.]|nr:hypothetical protein [Methanobacterium sp.]
METKRIWGLIILVVLVLSLVAAAYSIIVGPQLESQDDKQTITTNYTLTDAQMTGINRVNVKFNGNTTGANVKFQNKSDNLYNITIEREQGSAEPTVTYTQSGDVLNVDISLDSGSADIALGNRCTYNADLESKVGGFGLYLNNQGKMDNLNTTIKYIGGGILLLGDTTFNDINMNINMGGVMIQTLSDKLKSSGTINTNVQIGGVTMQLQPSDNLGFKVKGTYDLGGFTFNPDEFNVLSNNTTTTEIETPDYNNKSAQIQMESTVGLGGININMFYMPMEMFQEE